MQRLEVSGAVRHIYMSLGGKGLNWRLGGPRGGVHVLENRQISFPLLGFQSWSVPFVA